MGPRLSWPQVVAHRGAAAWVPEHTLAGYLEAIEEGAEALECDVRLTVDGHLVCVHDPRIDRTSDGTGRVSNKTLSQLKQHDFTAWWEGDAEPPKPSDARGDTILTLEQLLEIVVDSPRRLEMAIETKHPTRYGGLAEQALVRELRRFGLYRPSKPTTQVRVMSFSTVAMRRMRDLAPRIPTVYLMERTPRLLPSGHLPYEAGAAGPSVDIVRDRPDVVRRWQRRGLGVHVWTVDSRESLHACMAAGVDAVITNRPADVLRWRQEVWHEAGAGDPPAARQAQAPPGVDVRGSPLS